MTRRGRVALKIALWGACLAPLAVLGYRAWVGNLTANPISFLFVSLQRGLFAVNCRYSTAAG